ncbi:hypothetical protein [Clostridium sp. JN-1]|uniref:hypothetical protein n=1 Tax=Clostridium sp. JN-1 TaxID=2483110 RepID=UPI000F0B9BF5|nr:hypothetical protein [Clostridium sp. JN-1]
MEENKIITYNISNKYLSDALSWCGYHYYKFIAADGKKIYSFERTPEFMECLHQIVETKKLYGREF